MNKFLSFKITLLALLLFLLFYPQLLLAASLNDWDENLGNARLPTGYKDAQNIEEIIGKIINAVLGLLGVVFLCFMIYGGYLWLTAGGNEDRIKKAKNILVNSTIGLAVVLAAYAITYFVVEKLIGATSYVG